LAKVSKFSFPSEALLCSKDSLSLLNMRWYLTHLLKVLHLCWFNKRNNKRLLFVDSNIELTSQSFLISAFIKNQWEPKKKIVIQDKQNDFYLLKNSTLPNLDLTQCKTVTNKDQGKLKKDSTSFGTQLLSLTEAYKKNKIKSKFGANRGLIHGFNNYFKTKMTVFMACQNSRLPNNSTKSKNLIGLFSNSSVAFKTNYLILNNLLDYKTSDATKALYINKRTWSGFMPKRKHHESFLIVNRDSESNHRYNKHYTTAYERIIIKWYKKELTLIAKSPWKLEADMVFFTNPGKTYAMVEQIRRLGIPTSGLVDSTMVVQGSKSSYGLFAPSHSVDYAIIGNANSIYFVRSLITKFLALAKKTVIKPPKPRIDY